MTLKWQQEAWKRDGITISSP